ncbi:CsbD family protein [Streptomyces sp. NBC_00250]|uniref:CsbD family protein n=1 Tax=Streptomyces sp. NBC_00250 TaxID=2903641 RepID=UPI002E29A343|nr:CsbD family protein [Streptomyces sp. NBC_00250]
MRKSTVGKVKGEIKETTGEATGDSRLEWEGKADRMAAAAREGIEKVHRSAQRAQDEMRRRTS